MLLGAAGALAVASCSGGAGAHGGPDGGGSGGGVGGASGAGGNATGPDGGVPWATLDGTWTTPVVIATTQHLPMVALAAMCANGDGMVAWTEATFTPAQETSFYAYLQNNTWSAPATMPVTMEIAYKHVLACGGPGVFHLEDAHTDLSFTIAGGWSAPMPIPSDFDGNPVVVDANGTGWILYTSQQGTTRVQDVIVGKLAGGTLTAQKLDELPAPSGNFSLSSGTQSLRLVSLGGGALLALWYRPATVDQGSSPTRWAKFDGQTWSAPATAPWSTAGVLSVVADPSGGAFVGLTGGIVEHYDGQSTWTQWGSVGATRGTDGMLTFAPLSMDRTMVFRVDQPNSDKLGTLTSTPLTAGGAADVFTHGPAWAPSAVADEAGGVVLVSSFWPSGPPGISGQRYIPGQGWTAPVRVAQTPTVSSWAIATRTTDGSTTVIVLPDSNVAASRMQSVRFVPNHP
jgi:hypothetical protein